MGVKKMTEYDKVLAYTKTASRPSELKITDMRFAHVQAATDKHCILLKLYTNQGIVGLGEVRDGSSASYAAMLKSRLIGKNPCDVESLFRMLKQFGGPSRQAGGISGIEIALWDLAGKAYGIPVYRMLGGRFREKIDVYCDAGAMTYEQTLTGTSKGKALKEKMGRFGIKMCKAVLGVEDVQKRNPNEVVLSGPPSFMNQIVFPKNTPAFADLGERERYRFHRALNDQRYVPHPFTMLRITERGLDLYEEYLSDLREAVGWETPLAIDHLGNLGLDDAKRLLKRMEKYNLLWAEDALPWYMPEAYKELRQSTSTPLCAGEDAYLQEGFEPLCKNQSVAVIHPDVCSSGGILETKYIGNMAQKYGVAMACHMCETPVAALATLQVGLATENFFAMEFDAADDDYWQDIVTGLDEPLIQDGCISSNDKPGLGAIDFNDEVLEAHRWPGSPEIWEDTEVWNHERSNDRIWS